MNKQGEKMELKPCPFCGSEKVSLLPPTCKPSDPYNPADTLYPIARCGGCYTDVPGKNEDYSSDQRTAREAWNRRAS